MTKWQSRCKRGHTDDRDYTALSSDAELLRWHRGNNCAVISIMIWTMAQEPSKSIIWYDMRCITCSYERLQDDNEPEFNRLPQEPISLSNLCTALAFF